MNMSIPITLSSLAAAALLALWLMMRVIAIRNSDGVSIGDGGNEILTRRMRAHSNFAESAPLVLLLIAAIEIAGQGEIWLAWVSAIYFLSRIAHAWGMDGGAFRRGRTVATLISMLTLLGLAICAVLIGMGVY